MNVLFVGYRPWAYKIFANLLAAKSKQWKVKAVLTTHNIEKNFQMTNIPTIVVSPENLNDTKLLTQIANFSPDVILFYGWSWMIPKELYARYLCLALHPSPLPKYRGGSPIQHQIIKGENESAVSIFQVTEKIDSGPLYAQESFSLEGSLMTIFERIAKIGTAQTVQVLDGLASKTLKPSLQNEKLATLFKRRKPQESQLTLADFKNKTAKELYDFIRALADPYPNAYIVCKDGKKLFFADAALENSN